MLSETPILLQHPLSGWEPEWRNVTLRQARDTNSCTALLKRWIILINIVGQNSIPAKCSHHPECLQIAVIKWHDWDTRHIVMSTSWHQHQLPHQMLANNILILRNKIWDSWLVPDDPSPKSLMEHTDYNWINYDHCRQAPVSPISIMKNWNNNIQ